VVSLSFASQNVADTEPPTILAVLPEVSLPEKTDQKPVSDLALELVLNELVLQARLTTNATGAVLALAHSGELICRGTTGATAPDVAVCLTAKAGIAATCYETGEARRVDDLGPDPNADAVAYRQSGVRSILVVPVQGEKGPILGILEIFSPRANAFCDRDVLTLQALARRIATNIELVRQSGLQQSSLHQGTLPTTGTGAFRNSAKQSPTHGRRRVKPGSAKLRTPKFAAGILAQRSRLSSVDWISILAKGAIGLVLISGTMLARSCWQQSGNANFIELIREPMSEPSRVAAQHTVNRIAPSAAPALTKELSVDPSAWPIVLSAHPVSAHPEIGSSITIQREPIHHRTAPVEQQQAAKTSGATGNAAPFESHKTDSKGRIPQASKLPSKDPAAGILPSKTAEGSQGVEVIPTQAAMARLVQRVEPEYPNAARKQHITGTVLLDVTVNATGAVETLTQVSGESQLMTAAAQAVKQWHFQPLIKGGQAKPFESRIAIDFTLAIEAPSGNH
jgi:TonB family protein